MKQFLVIGVLLSLTISALAGDDFAYLPGTEYSPEVPTSESVTGHGWGEEILSYAEILAYLQKLDEYSSKVTLVPYARTWEGRTLHYLVIASEENHSRLGEIQNRIQRIARLEISASEAENMIRDLPVIVWLAYGVHGNEISSPQAALLTAYHLLAARDDEVVRNVLENCVVIIDPLQNPDGRDRFVNYFRQTRGRWPDPHPDSAEHNEVWPGGRSNHYFFDMNRDWFAVTQPETRGRVRSYLKWFPQVFADLHEMGGNSTYYFAPPADPVSPFLTETQLQWLDRLGRNNARWFDRFGFAYFTREVYDSFYPGYGEGWPMFHGSIGMTYEQASVRGLILDRDDETTLHFRDSVRHHFVASLSTLETAAENRAGLLAAFHDNRRSAVEEAARAPFQEYIFPPGQDPNRTRKLMNLLMEQGIQVYRAGESFTAEDVRGYKDDEPRNVQLPAETFIVPAAQPSGRLARTLLDRTTPMDEEFLEEQLRRRDRRLGDQFYDVTGWSLPLIYDVDAYRSVNRNNVSRSPVEGPLTYPGGVVGGPAEVAYLVPWGTNKAAELLASLFREEIRVFSSDQPFTMNGRQYGRGSLVVRVQNNPEDLYERLQKLASEIGVSVYATNSGWVEDGVNLGSRYVRYLRKPKVAMAYNNPTSSSSVGATRYILEQMFGYPVTLLHTDQLRSAALKDFNVLILPDAWGRGGSYGDSLGDRGVDGLKDWITKGGTLVTLGEATRWLTEDKVGILPTEREYKKSDKKATAEPAESGSEKNEEGADEAIQPERELPDTTPGAILRVKVDDEEWPGFGYDGDASVMVNSRRIFTALKIDRGINVARYADDGDLLLSGFTWEESLEQLAGKAYLMYVRRGGGNVVAFAEDPNFRAFMDGLNLLFLNAVLLGPGH